MKKYLLIILFSFVLIGFILYINFNQKKELILNENSKEEIKPTGMNSLAIMLQNEDGGYDLSDADTWPTSGYQFNPTLSRCENGGKLSWNEETKSITLKTGGSDKCYVYFDIANYVNENIQLLTEKAKFMNETNQGVFLQHTADLEDSAKDNGYRYSGNNPNNFICFGAGSEEYNKNGEDSCPLTNQYRIIGIVPVTKADGNKDTLVKVIKSEYIIASELKGADGKKDGDQNSFTSIPNPRIQIQSEIQGFRWNETPNAWSDNKYNYWSKEEGVIKKATLNTLLNTTYLNITLGSNWSKKIAEVEWNVGGVDTNKYTPSEMKTKEESIDLGGSIKSKDKIGLMYVYDYGFACAKENWVTLLSRYNNEENKNGNWLFNGFYEWTITRNTVYTYNSDIIRYVFGIDGYGGYMNFIDILAPLVVRPVFYLKSNVKIISDEKVDGSYLHPYKIEL